MKSIFKILLLSVLSLSLYNCDNDDGNADNQNTCNYQGISYLDTNDNTQILIPEASLRTEVFLNPNGGDSDWEVFGTASSGDFISVIYAPSIGQYEILINSTLYPVSIAEIRNDNVVGGEIRADISHSGFEVEVCVIIDEVN